MAALVDARGMAWNDAPGHAALLKSAVFREPMKLKPTVVLAAAAFAGITWPVIAQTTVSPLIDKTLVVWVAPANLTQRGGSALTIEDGRDRFDGVVFGELAAAKWMAGSDLFTRTQKDQTNFPAETADATTFVQIAMVYQGRQITTYRNGQPYSQQTMRNEPQAFGPQSVVLMGKRHRRQHDTAHFAGKIDDARIYDRALSAAQIAALKPNVASELDPWAWWSFEDNEA